MADFVLELVLAPDLGGGADKEAGFALAVGNERKKALEQQLCYLQVLISAVPASARIV